MHVEIEVELGIIDIALHFITGDKDILTTYLRRKDEYMTLFRPVLVLVPTLVNETVGNPQFFSFTFVFRSSWK
jgi:hypothetical protein